MTELDDIVRRSLTSFASACLDGSWRGRREREAVSLFVFGHLLRQVSGDGFLRDAAQIGIEVPVPQVAPAGDDSASSRPEGKRQVCKDVVIWSEPGGTCWDADGGPTVAPACIIEWKFDEATEHAPDVAWLAAFSEANPGFIGYVVTANPPGRGFRLSCTRVSEGTAEPGWLLLQ